MIGEYSITVTLIDYHEASYSENFTLRIHSPPLFNVELKKYFKIRIGSVYVLELPMREKDGIECSHSSLPNFAFYENFLYQFKPITIKHLGLFTVKGKLQN